MGWVKTLGDNSAGMTTNSSLTSALQAHIAQAMALAKAAAPRPELQSGPGWIGFDTFMALALYTPGLGYYANDSTKFGKLPFALEGDAVVAGSDFVTAPELSPLFGQTLATQVAQALAVTKTTDIWEFGAGSGALALQVLDTLAILGQPLAR